MTHKADDASFEALRAIEALAAALVSDAAHAKSCASPVAVDKTPHSGLSSEDIIKQIDASLARMIVGQ